MFRWRNMGAENRDSEGAIEIHGDSEFQLHKWHSNIAELERNLTKDGEISQQRPLKLWPTKS